MLAPWTEANEPRLVERSSDFSATGPLVNVILAGVGHRSDTKCRRRARKRRFCRALLGGR